MTKLFLALSLALSAMPILPLRAQSNESEFTRDELFKVTRFFLSDDKAREMVEALFAEHGTPSRQSDGRSGSLQQPLPSGMRELTVGAVGGITYTDDTLVLLSLLSAETNEKVEKYRKRWPRSAEEETKWRARRAELSAIEEVKKWLAENSR
jgi:hypothetical protein